MCLSPGEGSLSLFWADTNTCTGTRGRLQLATGRRKNSQHCSVSPAGGSAARLLSWLSACINQEKPGHAEYPETPKCFPGAAESPTKHSSRATRCHLPRAMAALAWG